MRQRTRRTFSLLLALVMVLASAPCAFAADGYTDGGDVAVQVVGTECYTYAYEVVELVNEERAKNGQAPLEIDDQLMEVAMQRAAECAVSYSHTRPNGTSCMAIFPPDAGASTMAENIAAGFDTPSQVMNGWNHSAGHHGNIIDSSFTSIGVGCFYANGVYYWTQNFSDGMGTPHTQRQDETTAVSVPVNFENLSVETSYGEITMKAGETQLLAFLVENTDFSGALTTVLLPIEDCLCTGDAIRADAADGTVTALAPGSATLEVSLPGGTSVTFQIRVTELFSDVTQKDWFYDAALYVYSHGLMQGTSETTFSPELTTSRSMVAAILYNIEGQPAVSRVPFDDVPAGLWCADAVSWAVSNGIAEGYGDGTFGPEDTLSREEIAVIFYRYAQWKGLQYSVSQYSSDFADADSVTESAVPAMQWATAVGLMNGNQNNMLLPQDTVTRAQIATLLRNFCERVLF